MTNIEDGYLAQKDGCEPTTLIAGSAPGESGVSVRRMRFDGGALIEATPRQHLIWFQMSPKARFDCRIGGDELQHEP